MLRNWRQSDNFINSIANDQWRTKLLSMQQFHRTSYLYFERDLKSRMKIQGDCGVCRNNRKISQVPKNPHKDYKSKKNLKNKCKQVYVNLHSATTIPPFHNVQLPTSCEIPTYGIAPDEKNAIMLQWYNYFNQMYRPPQQLSVQYPLAMWTNGAESRFLNIDQPINAVPVYQWTPYHPDLSNQQQYVYGNDPFSQGTLYPTQGSYETNQSQYGDSIGQFTHPQFDPMSSQEAEPAPETANDC